MKSEEKPANRSFKCPRCKTGEVQKKPCESFEGGNSWVYACRECKTEFSQEWVTFNTGEGEAVPLITTDLLNAFPEVSKNTNPSPPSIGPQKEWARFGFRVAQVTFSIVLTCLTFWSIVKLAEVGPAHQATRGAIKEASLAAKKRAKDMGNILI